MSVKTWKIIDRGGVPEAAQFLEFTCTQCGYEAMLPVVGFAIAQVGQGLVFDNSIYNLPTTIQCRKCGRVLTNKKDA